MNGIGSYAEDGNASLHPFLGNWSVLGQLADGLQKVSQGGNTLAYDPSTGYARPWDLYQKFGSGTIDPTVSRFADGSIETLASHRAQIAQSDPNIKFWQSKIDEINANPGGLPGFSSTIPWNPGIRDYYQSELQKAQASAGWNPSLLPPTNPPQNLLGAAQASQLNANQTNSLQDTFKTRAPIPQTPPTVYQLAQPQSPPGTSRIPTPPTYARRTQFNPSALNPRQQQIQQFLAAIYSHLFRR